MQSNPTKRPIPPAYDDQGWAERVARWRHEHPEEDAIFRNWEAVGCDILMLSAVASAWVIQWHSGYPATRQETITRRTTLERLLHKVEKACTELATFLLENHLPQEHVAHYRDEANKAARKRGVLPEAFNVDRLGRGADLSSLIAVEEEIRRRTGHLPGVHLDKLLRLTAHAYGLNDFDYDPESLRKSLAHFRKNPKNEKTIRYLTNTPLCEAFSEALADISNNQNI